MTNFLQFLVAGVSIGAIYALVAIGFSVIYRATHVVNFAQGEFVMIGGLAAAGALGLGLPLPAAAALAVGLALLAALLLDQVVARLARFAPIILIIIVTIGASIALRGAAQLAWGSAFHSIPGFAGARPIDLGGVTVMPQVVLILAVTLALVVGLETFFRRARFGRAMIAAAINPLAASLVGIELRRVYAATFALAGLLGALAGLLVTPLAMIHFDAGLMFGLKGFAAAILGGLGNPAGAVVGGLVLGIIEALCAGYLSSAYKDAIAFVLIVAVLLTRPQGFFGVAAAGRV